MSLLFISRVLSYASSTHKLVISCVMSHRIPRISSVSFVSEQVTVFTSSSSFDCSIFKTARSQSISSFFCFKLLRPDIPCWPTGCYAVWCEPPCRPDDHCGAIILSLKHFHTSLVGQGVPVDSNGADEGHLL
jgi:hypothetical protein